MYKTNQFQYSKVLLVHRYHSLQGNKRLLQQSGKKLFCCQIFRHFNLNYLSQQNQFKIILKHFTFEDSGLKSTHITPVEKKT